MPPQRVRIALVDTDIGTLRLLEEIFNQLDHTIKIDMVLNARAVLRYLSRHPQDAVIRQIIVIHRPPAINAVDLLESISGRMSGFPIIKTVFILRPERSLQERCMKAGASQCYELPQLPSTLKLLIKRLLTQPPIDQQPQPPLSEKIMP